MLQELGNKIKTNSTTRTNKWWSIILPIFFSLQRRSLNEHRENNPSMRVMISIVYGKGWRKGVRLQYINVIWYAILTLSSLADFMLFHVFPWSWLCANLNGIVSSPSSSLMVIAVIWVRSVKWSSMYGSSSSSVEEKITPSSSILFITEWVHSPVMVKH